MTEIQQFYNGKNVFITGGTGFMGKILLEKLLRSCPGIGTIYLLTRPKKGKNLQERLSHMTNLEMFEPLRKIDPNFEKKIVPLTGDAVKPGLGLSSEDRELITRTVSIAFHVAATTKFDEPIKIATDINLKSVMDLISICKECKQLKAAVYVSTAFSNCMHDYIGEKIYSPPMSYEDLNKILEDSKDRHFSKEEEEEFTQSVIGKFPNTYSFTKAIAEALVNEKAKDLPFCVYRFSIAMASFKEPVPGWVDVAQGLNLATIGIGIGVIRVVCLKADGKMDMVPIDYACNCLIASAWETSIAQRRPSEDLRVYNFVSSTDNPLTWNKYRAILRKYGPDNAPVSIIYYPDTIFIESDRIHAFLHILFHLIPAVLGDLVLRMMGKKPILHKVYQKGTKLMHVLKFFMKRDWEFDTRNVRSLWNKISDQDKEIFNFDVTNYKWYDVISANCEGMKKYIMKEDMGPETREIAKLRFKRFYMLHQVVKLLFAVFVLWLTWKFYCLLFNRQ